MGADKTRTGTPDSFIPTKTGGYIFVECTTQQTKLLDKFQDDIRKCFDEVKTGISNSQIERIILCFNSVMTLIEEDALYMMCREKGVMLDILSIDNLSADLYSKYPGIARDFLGVKIDTGQILSSEKFVETYNKNKLVTRLDTAFSFREKELDEIVSALNKQSLVTLYGKAGVGKSRLAIEAIRKFKESHDDFEVLCILGQGLDLWEDIQVWFKRPGKFLIFVDDANRITQFEYLIRLLLNQDENSDIKVIATIRDYALSKIQNHVQMIDNAVSIEIKDFSDEEIKSIITDEYEITNYFYLERIVDVAKGNARLAIMAAEIAKDSDLNSIYDVSVLYDRYFSSVRDDLKTENMDLGQGDMLKVAAIISFFKSVDRTNEDLMERIKQSFDISQQKFWEVSYQLHQIEIVDMYEDEVVRISDQVLGTYLFYRAMFKEKVCDFGILLRDFFPDQKYRIIDSINPVLNAFNGVHIAMLMEDCIEITWREFVRSGNDERLYHLIEMFWYVKRTDSLSWVKEKIDDIEVEEVDKSAILFDRSASAIPSPSIMSILRCFAYNKIEDIEIALDLLMRYVKKKPSDVSFVLRILIEDFGFNPDSYLREFEIQKAVINILWNFTEREEGFFAKIFIAVASNYLNTHFSNHSMKSDAVMQITNFDLFSDKDLNELRGRIWDCLFVLYGNNNYKIDILNLISKYSFQGKSVDKNVKLFDEKYVTLFLRLNLDADNYWHCVIFHEYLDMLELNEIDVSEDYRKMFRGELFELAEYLCLERTERRKLNFTYEEYNEYKKEQLEKHVVGFDFDDYVDFFRKCIEIQKSTNGDSEKYRFQGRIVNAILLASHDSHLYENVIRYYIGLGDPFSLYSEELVRKFVELKGFDSAENILLELDFSNKKKWIFDLHRILPDDMVTERWLRSLYDLYNASNLNEIPYHLDFLLKYAVLDPSVLINVIKIIFAKINKKDDFAHALGMVFNPYLEISSKIPEIFYNDFDFLKKLYLLAEEAGKCDDYDNQVLDYIINEDADFVIEYINSKFKNSKNKWISSNEDHKNYTFIWMKDDYVKIMDRVVHCIYENEKDNFLYSDSYLRTFFAVNCKDESLKLKIVDFQNDYIKGIIRGQNKDIEFMAFIFNMISNFELGRRLIFIEDFIKENTILDHFERIPLEPSVWSYQGSKIPLLQRRVDFWESVLRLMNIVELLPHKQHVERKIHSLRSQIECEKKRDFMRD